MAAYIVTCGFPATPDQLELLAAQLSTHGTYRQLNRGMWLLQTEEEAFDILPGLVAQVGNRSLFVARLQGDAAWEGYTSSLGSWLTDVLLDSYDCDQTETESMALALASLAARPVRLNS